MANPIQYCKVKNNNNNFFKVKKKKKNSITVSEGWLEDPLLQARLGFLPDLTLRHDLSLSLS